MLNTRIRLLKIHDVCKYQPSEYTINKHNYEQTLRKIFKNDITMV